jgi:hypothetical protein
MTEADRAAWAIILNRLAAAGVTIRATDEGKLRLSDSNHQLDPRERAWLKQHQSELLDCLTPAARPTKNPRRNLSPRNRRQTEAGDRPTISRSIAAPTASETPQFTPAIIAAASDSRPTSCAPFSSQP